MKIIDIPEPVAVAKDQDNKDVKIPFMDFIRNSLDMYEKLGKGIKQIRQAVKIHGIIDSVNGEKVIRFEDTDYEVVKEAVDSAGWKPVAARKMLSFYDAVEKAQNVKA